MDDEGRLVLSCLGTHKDLTENRVTLKEGMKLVFYTDDEDDEGKSDDLVVEGTIERDAEKNRWVARINWDEIKNISRLSRAEKKQLGIA